jgi:hypothetical protein
VTVELGAQRSPVDRDRFIRRVLLASAVFNVGGALAFAFPSSVGKLLGLPPDVPTLYLALVTLFVLLFGGLYAWVALQPRIDRPMVALGAIGKAAAFFVFLGCWAAGEVPARAVLGGAGDLALAAIFAWWLVRTSSDEEATSVARVTRSDESSEGAGASALRREMR